MRTEYTYIAFQEIGSSESGKTTRWTVRNRRSSDPIGKILWYGPWRQYCFFPDDATVYSVGCLADIQDFIGQLKESRNANPPHRHRRIDWRWIVPPYVRWLWHQLDWPDRWLIVGRLVTFAASLLVWSLGCAAPGAAQARVTVMDEAQIPVSQTDGGAGRCDHHARRVCEGRRSAEERSAVRQLWHRSHLAGS